MGFSLPLMSLGLLRRLLEVLLSFATDSRYSSAGIENALKLAYGDSSSSFFESGGGGAKVAIVGTTTDDSSTCIFTNYNGPGKRAEDCG